MPKGLELKARRKIYRHLVVFPGSYLREMERKLKLPASVINHHLKYLQDNDFVATDTNGYYKRYYPIEKIDYRDRKIISLLRQKLPRRITVFLLTCPYSTHKQLTKKFKLSPSTISFHLRKLLESNIIKVEKKGREHVYSVIDENRIAKLLITYRSSFLDEVVDRFVGVWLEIR